MTRYDNLDLALDRLALTGLKHLNFLEVGTHNGIRAARLLNQWRHDGTGRTANYFGFDFFEDMTPVLARAELSKKVLAPPLLAVEVRLKHTGAEEVHLYRGNTLETLPAKVDSLPNMNLIFVDGGHSLPTIDSDWTAVKELLGKGTECLFDDYYENRHDYGCKVLVDRLRVEDNSPYKIELLDPVDHVAHTQLDIRMVRVTLL